MAPASTKPLPLALALLLLLLLAGAALALEELPSAARQRLNGALASASKSGPPSAACGTKSLVIVYGSNNPTDLGPLIDDQPPLPRLPPVSSGADVEMHQASAASCLGETKRVRGTLLVVDDGGLGSSLSILSNLQSVGESLIVYGTGGSSLTSLSGLGSLESVGNLAVARLPKLTSLAGLERLRAINGGLALWRLPELQTLDAMGPVQVVQERVWIENTPKLLSLGRLPPLPPLPPSPPLGGAETAAAPLPPKITRAQGPSASGGNDDNVSGLSALRSVGLDLHIQNTDLPSLELPYVATLGGEIALINNKRLASTQGLRSLQSVQGVALIGNSLLADVDGFSKIAELKGDLSLVRNGAIQSVNGFSNLQAVGLSVDISSNPQLRSLDGLKALQSVGQLLNVAFNPALEAMRGFGALRSTGADLIVRNNQKMKELTDLGASLQVVGAGPSGGALIVEGNEALTSLAPLASPPLRVVRGAVRVRAGNGFSSAVSAAPGGDAGVRAIEALSQPTFTFGPAAAVAPGTPAAATGGATMVPSAAATPVTTPTVPAATPTPTPVGPVAAGPPARVVTAVDPAPRAAVVPTTPVAAGPAVAPPPPAAGPVAAAAAPFVNTLG